MKAVEPPKPKNTFHGIGHAQALLKKLLEFQAAADYYREALEEFLNEDQARVEAWNRFRTEGGKTDKDLYHWRCGRPMPSAVKAKAHLRVVGGDEAA